MPLIWIFYILQGIYIGGTDANEIEVTLSPKSLKCILGEVVENNCMECVCKPNRAYHCNKKTCDEDAYSILLGKPKKSHCIPRMTYVFDRIICLCGKFGYWPHEKCDTLFKSLNKKTLPATQFEVTDDKEEAYFVIHVPKKPLSTDGGKPVSHNAGLKKCKPNSYVIIDCNVCQCDNNGFINQQRCTKNDCSSNNIRRMLGNFHGNCETGTWYSLASCQFCYCANENRLVCSTGNSRTNDILELGAYNLTVCGKDLLKEVLQLMPDGQKALREQELERLETETTPYPEATSAKYFYRTNPVTASSIPYENDLNNDGSMSLPVHPNINKDNSQSPVEYFTDDRIAKYQYEEFGRNNTLGWTTAVPYESDANVVSNEVDSEEDVVAPPRESVDFTTTAPPPVAQPVFVADSEQISPSNQPSDPNIVRIQLPSVLDKLLALALRKSMVTLQKTEANCVPGSSTRNKCNFCYCLANGKMLCTDKKCE